MKKLGPKKQDNNGEWWSGGWWSGGCDEGGR